MEVYTVTTSDHEIKVGEIFNDLTSFLKDHDFSKHIVFLDENTHKYCYPVFQKKLENLGINFHPVIIQSGEEQKNLQTCEYLWDELTSLNTDRKSLVINLSGGVLSDMGGFVASAYKRGVAFINIPTTLLSMVDASVGGKLGVDFKGLKNHIGLFKNPLQVFIYPGFLKTLSNRELLSGFAEILKHGLIADNTYFNRVKDAGNPLEIEQEQWKDFVSESVEIKNRIVEADPREANQRKILNFGHTAGHAIESWSFETDEPLIHGEAIAIGMIIELYLSGVKLGLSEDTVSEVTDFIFEHFPYYSEIHNASTAQLINIMRQDKKNRHGNILFTLLEEPGKARYDIPVTEQDIIEGINYYLNYTR